MPGYLAHESRADNVLTELLLDSQIVLDDISLRVVQGVCAHDARNQIVQCRYRCRWGTLGQRAAAGRASRCPHSGYREAVYSLRYERRVVVVQRARGEILRETAHAEPTADHKILSRSGSKAETGLEVRPVGLYPTGCAHDKGVATSRARS